MFFFFLCNVFGEIENFRLCNIDIVYIKNKKINLCIILNIEIIVIKEIEINILFFFNICKMKNKII